MEKDPIKMPSARLPVTFLKDVDVLALYEKKAAGLVALWAWCGLLLVAKDTKNNGVFVGPPSRYCARLGMSAKQLESAMKLLNEVAVANGNKPWIVKRANGFALRNWAKWNRGSEGWGGARDGAGRKRLFEEPEELKNKARKLLHKAIADGLVIKPDACQLCGFDGFIEAHHHDYSQPTDVLWLCRPCHGKQHSVSDQDDILNNQDEYSSGSSCSQPSSSPSTSSFSDTNQPVNTDTENGGGLELRLRRDDPISDVDVCTRLLREVGVNGLALDFFPTFPGITPAMVMRACEKPSKGPLRPGLVIHRLKTWLKTDLPSAKSIAPELQRIQAIVKNRSQRYP
jgi:hypothetical protein